jgi:hypothetical protein
MDGNLKKKEISQVLVLHSHNPNYLGGYNEENNCLASPGKQFTRPPFPK